MDDGNFTLNLYGWKETGIKIDSVYKSDIAQNIMPVDAPIVVNKWFPAAHIDFYIASTTRRQTYALGNLFDLHHYHWLNLYKRPLKKGDSAYFIIPSNLYKQEDIEQLKQSFSIITPPVDIPIFRSGALCKRVYIFKLKGYRSAAASSVDDLNSDRWPNFL